MLMDICMIAMLFVGFGLMRLFVYWNEKQIDR